MSCQYLFKVEVSVDEFELWTFPEEIDADEAASLPTTFKFTVQPSLCLEITEDEFIDQVNIGKRCTKTAIVSYDVKDLEKEINGQIKVFKIDEKKPVFVGCYEIEDLCKMFKQLVQSFIMKVNVKDGDCRENVPTCDVKKELAPLVG